MATSAHPKSQDSQPPSFSKLGATIWLIAVAAGSAIALTPASGTPQPTLVRPSGSIALAGTDIRIDGKRCEECHTFDDGFSHPVNIVPGMRVPAGLPLESGRMSCLTCHDPAAPHGRGAGDMLRPTATGVSLCAECHTQSDQRTRSVHGFGLETAHYRTGKSQDAHTFGIGRLDKESETCMGCHDGTTASDAGSHALPGFSMADRSDHPIGITYRQTNKGSEFRLVDPNRLDKRVRLFDQAVGCGSCHSPYSKQDDLLVMSNVQSRLCMACHQQ